MFKKIEIISLKCDGSQPNVFIDVLEYPEWYDGLNKEFKLPTPHGLKVEYGTKAYQEIAKKVREFYFGNQPLSKETWIQFSNVSNFNFFFFIATFPVCS